MSEAALILSAQNLLHRYGKHGAVENVTLRLNRGEVLGLLGHNGAGKSTTLQMLAGVLAPQQGSISICGYDLVRQPLDARARIGFLPEVPPLYRDMRVNDFLAFAAALRLVPKRAIPDALARVKQRCGLESAGRKLIGTLSKGFQQRTGIAQAIVHNPEIIILDEPTVGLDPAQIRDIRNLIRELGDAKSVILSTHLLSEVETLCDRVEILHHGRLIYSGTPEHMKQHGNGEMTLEDVFMSITGDSAPLAQPENTA